MIDLIFGNIFSIVLNYIPYALLFILAFKRNLRFSLKTSIWIMVASLCLRTTFIELAKVVSSHMVIVYNYLDILVLVGFGLLIVKSKKGRMLFVGLMLKNTSDTIVILAKFLEGCVNRSWAEMGYHWTYSVSLVIVEAVLLPIVYYVVKKYFTHEIREKIATGWSALWVVPFFFYLTWIFVFYYSSDVSDLMLALEPINSVFLICSIVTQYIIYISMARLVESLQNEVKLQAENHAIQIQTLQYEYMSEQMTEARKYRHDMKHHITALSSLVENKDYEELARYLEQYLTPSVWRSNITYCSNTILNIMASYYAGKCNENNIECYIELSVPEHLPLTDAEITILFGNLLDNAFDACMEIPEDSKRQITFKGDVINNALLFSIENTYINKIQKSPKGIHLSTKHAGPGLGIASCKDIIEKYNASIDFVEADTFIVNIMF